MGRELSYSFADVVAKSEKEFVDHASATLAKNFAALGPEDEQIAAWEETARWLHRGITATQNANPQARLVFELAPPLELQRSDFVILSKSHIIVGEAKTGKTESSSAAKKQAKLYAETLYNFVDYSRSRIVVPLLVRQNAPNKEARPLPASDREEICELIDLRPEFLDRLLIQLEVEDSYASTDPSNWLLSPRPDIIRAARVMLGETSDRGVVAALTDDDELKAVIAKCEELATRTQDGADGVRNAVIAITGVPGAGKTLVGLRLAHSSFLHTLSEDTESTAPLYLSGNRPLVDVLSEALIRDHCKRTSCSKAEATKYAKSKIRLVHGLTTDKFQVRVHVLIFDEAQRAWTEEHMRQKLGRTDLGSEAEEILKKMEDSELGWSVVICLVGTGQQINSGERGLQTWVEALEQRRSKKDGRDWILYVDPQIQAAEGLNSTCIRPEPNLNLKVVRRAHNASALGEWVNQILNSRFEDAALLRAEFPDFPLYVCRDIDIARRWLRSQTSKFETCGLVASSKSARLSVYGVDAHTSASDAHDWPQWYLEQPPNLNSAKNLEIAASEFKCQGLELDWVGVCWSWDLIHSEEKWIPRKINKRSGRWNKNTAKGEYVVNAYRILLTRARNGMVIWIPEGLKQDISRNPNEVNQTAKLLLAAGCVELPKTTPTQTLSPVSG